MGSSWDLNGIGSKWDLNGILLRFKWDLAGI